MHFEILVEDQSGKSALKIIVPKIIGKSHTCKIHAYKGIGRIPKLLRSTGDPRHRILLDQLPRLLAGYGRTFQSYPDDYSAAVFLICDLDNKCLRAFRHELHSILENCIPKPKTRFCIAIEEGEAWFLGDIPAIKSAFPNANRSILESYVNDSICGTWEFLADVLYPGGAASLSSMGWQSVGAEKSRWAENISPHMNLTRNNSPSFNYFRDKLLELCSSDHSPVKALPL